MLSENVVTSISNAADKALSTVPGVVGAVYFMRDPDGPGDGRMSGAVVSISEENAHMSIHALEGIVGTLRKRPEGLGEQAREMMTEGLERWTADVADVVETIIKDRVEKMKDFVRTSPPAGICEHESDLGQRVGEEIEKHLPVMIREVMATFIKGSRDGWEREAKMTADSVATFMWDLATTPVCSGRESPETGA